MHGGEVVEYDEPHLLLCQPSSYLGMLVDHTGNVTAQKLRTIALEKYNYRAKSWDIYLVPQYGYELFKSVIIIDSY